MLEFLVVLLFVWMFWQSVKLTFRLAWGTAKVIAVILFILSVPALVLCLLFAGGVALLLPLLPVAIGGCLLRSCL